MRAKEFITKPSHHRLIKQGANDADSIKEELVNYNHLKQAWQVRNDDNYSIRHEKDKVILRNPESHIDDDAYLDGKRVYAYMKGAEVKQEPDLSGYDQHPIKFVPDDRNNPFVHKTTGEPIENAEYAVFQKHNAYLYTKSDQSQLAEGVNDPAIFKVVFVIGGPGSGKSYVSRKLGLNAMGFVTINSDVAFEYLMKKHNISPKMPPDEEEKRNVIRSRAKEIAAMKSDNAIEGRLGIHIDGTGDDYEKISNLKTNFERLGYDTTLVIVNTKLEVAKQRNQARNRTVPEKLLVASWYNVQNNIGRFANMFSDMSVIDNNATDDTEYTDQQINKTYTKLKKFATTEPTKPAAKEWIKNRSTVNSTQ